MKWSHGFILDTQACRDPRCLIISIIGASVMFDQSSYSVEESEMNLTIRVILFLSEGAILDRDLIVSVKINATVEEITNPLLLASPDAGS